MTSKLDAVIFDADGVIFDSEKLWDIGDGQFMASRGVNNINEEIKAKLAGTSLIDGTTLLLSSHGVIENFELAAQERLKIMESLYAEQIEYMDGFIPFFNWLKSTRLKTAVATSMSKKLFPFVNDKTGFMELFTGNVFSVSDVQNAKPSPDIYIHAAKSIHVNPGNCLVIEDAPNGIKSAKFAGMFCIGISTTFQPQYLQEADLICNTFQEIKDYLYTLDTFTNN